MVKVKMNLVLADADDDESDDEIYRRPDDGEGEDEPCTEIDLDVFASEMQDSGPQTDTSKLTKFSTLLPKDRETAMMAGTMNQHMIQRRLMLTVLLLHVLVVHQPPVML